MARITDTRERVRVLADEMVAQGGVPSSRKILEMLGNKGSLSTITDELSKWEKARNGGAELAPPLQSAEPKPELTSESPHEPASVDSVTAQLGRLLDICSQMSEELRVLRAEMSAMKEVHAEQMTLAYSRYESVQKHALLQIDEARQGASGLREKVKSLSSELDTREMAHSGKLQAVREENARLRGKLEALTGTSESHIAR